MRKNIIVAVFVTTSICLLTLGLYGLLTAEEYDPTSFDVGLHRTDLLNNGGDLTPVNVFDGAGVAVTVDLVTNPGDVFGEGEVPVGTYNRIMLTLANLVSVAGTNPCDDISAYAGTFRIDDGLLPDAQVQVYFATADDGGNSIVYSDGSALAPFLMMNPIVVEEGETTVVRLAFYTSGSLVCQGGTDVNLRPPAIAVASFLEGVPQVVDPSGDYWFVRFNINAHLYDEMSGDWIDPDVVTVDDLLNRVSGSTGWGSLSLTTPISGTGNWSIADASWRNGGYGEHRHNLATWDAAGEEGYAGTAIGLPITGTYQLTGNHMFIRIGDSAAMEGYIAEDGRSFILVNISGVDDSGVVFAIKKATGFPSELPDATFVVVSPQIELRYDTTGLSPYPATEVGFNGELSIIRGGAMDDIFSWRTEMDLEYDHAVGSTISGVYGYAPIEDSQHQAGISSALAFDSTGFATTSPENNEVFIGIGGDSIDGYLGLYAGQGAEESDGGHRLQNGFIIEADPSPDLADLTGRWALMGINWQGHEGVDGNWYTGDEEYEMMTTFGIIEFDGTGNITWHFTNKDIISQNILSETGSGNVTAATEYYEVGNPLDNNSPNAIELPVFHVTQSATSSTVVARIVLDKGGNTVLFWSPLDSGDIPDTASSVDAASQFNMGAAVKIN